ncbi:MAG: tRNA pseudouridine synthase B [uncultured bacterium]|nr:MAG: tRNA pseudouridine synthase B [uncultured bacterium]
MNNSSIGYILLDKPIGWSSFDCVSYIKRKYSLKKAGHGGSLDPIATGLLLILINNATKWFDNLHNHYKTYEVAMLLGASFDTLDITGNMENFYSFNSNKSNFILNSTQTEFISPTSKEVNEVLLSFKGESYQTPPKYSALKINGKSAYEYARKGKAVEMIQRKIFVDDIELTHYNFPKITFKVTCSKGFYVRSLCNDIAGKLGTLGVMYNLRRISQAGNNINEALEISKLPMNIDDIIIPKLPD